MVWPSATALAGSIVMPQAASFTVFALTAVPVLDFGGSFGWGCSFGADCTDFSRLSESTRKVPALTTRSPSLNPFNNLYAIAKAPSHLHVARLKDAMGPFDEDPLLSS